MENTALLSSLLVASLLCTTTAQLCQKQAALRSVYSPGNARSFLNPFLIISLALLGLGLLSWLYVLKYLDVSVAYPLLSINYVLVLIGSRWVFKEAIPRERWFGSLLIITGIIVLLSDL